MGENILDDKTLKTGTTTVGIVCKDCVILAADTRATAGSMIMDDDVDKVLPIARNMALTISGGVSAAQLVIKHIKSQIKLHELRVQRSLNTKEVSNMVSGWLYSIIRSGGIAHFLIAGYDVNGAQLFDVFPDGSVIQKTKYHSSGSGSVFAFGVLDSNYKEHMTEAEGIALAEKAIQTAILRDTGSGNGLNVFVINKDGVKKAVSKLIDSKFK